MLEKLMRELMVYQTQLKEKEELYDNARDEACKELKSKIESIKSLIHLNIITGFPVPLNEETNNGKH